MNATLPANGSPSVANDPRLAQVLDHELRAELRHRAILRSERHLEGLRRALGAQRAALSKAIEDGERRVNDLETQLEEAALQVLDAKEDFRLNALERLNAQGGES